MDRILSRGSSSNPTIALRLTMSTSRTWRPRKRSRGFSISRKRARTIDSAGRPGKLAATQEMQVQVRHGLTGDLAAIDHQAISRGQPELLSQLDRDDVQVAQERRVGFGDGIVRGDDSPRD